MKTDGQRLRRAVAPAMLVIDLLCGNVLAQTAVVSIAATQPATSEPRPDARVVPGEFTISRNTTGAQPLVVYLRYDGSALSGADYSALPPQVTIPAGELSAAFNVIALSDPNADEGEENVVAFLQSPPAGTVPSYTLDPQNWSQVVIHDGPSVPPPSLITITSTTVTPEHCNDTMLCAGINFQLTRGDTGIEAPLTVLLHYEGTATAGVDYQALPASVTFAAGANTASLFSNPIDDTLVEGDETIIAVIDDPPPVTPPDQPAYRHFNTSDRATVTIRDNDGPPPVPVVTIHAEGFPPKTAEPCPVCFVAPVRVTLARSGPLDHPLSVGLQTGGTATSGVDYAAVPDPFVIPAGAASASFFLNPLDDALPEGPEVVEITVRSSANYSLGEPASVMAVMADDDPDAPSERLDFVDPAHGAAFPAGVPSIYVRALAVSTRGEIDHPTQFYANGVLIGESNPPQYGRPSIPWLPREHDMVWNAPADGQYTLTARVQVSLNQWLEAPPINITVGSVPERPVVSIVATQRIAEESSEPTMRAIVFRGVFTISRTGDVANPLPVYLHVSGTAVSGQDYKPLPFMVTIPAGFASATVQVEAIPDGIREPLETVLAEVSNCPPDRLLPPCYDFEIDAAHERDTVFIRDDGITRATLEITAPPNEAHFTVGQDITIDCTAIDIDDAITAIDFFAGSQKIGSSQIFFIVQPEPGTPMMHSFIWTGAPAGTHQLTTRATASSGAQITSAPVNITVGDNQAPRVSLTSLVDGAQFPVGSAVEIAAAATDPDGYVNYAEFFANGHKLGDMRLDFLVPPPPGETQTFSFTWRDAPPGSHMLSVRVRADSGTQAVSAPVTIIVTVSDGLPVVVVLPSDPFGVEPSAGLPANTASFRLRRYGAISAGLAVNFSLNGSATNGTDYTTLTFAAFFADGESSVPVVIEPLADSLDEDRETVILQVEPQFDDGPLRYHVGYRRRAIAVIADQGQHSASYDCTPLGGGLFHLCFPAAEAIPGFRVEATADFLCWETVHESTATNDAVHFIDPESPDRLRRFYRLAPDPEAANP
ncbi:MAG: Calx-beta domain-containing protein [Verrucomicrobiales bacterium]